MSSLRDRVEDVRRRVERAAERAHRLPSEVRIVAVSKTVAPAVIVEAYGLGLREFGENRVQEFRQKRQVLDSMDLMPEARWHLVGHLQSNKARLAVGLFDIIQSVDSVRLARLIDRCAGEVGKRLPIFLQVDYTGEPQRYGFDPEELEAAAGDLVGLPNLDIQGLMTIAPFGLGQDELRAVFRRMRQQRDRLAARHPGARWHHLSMGMSDDFELAIEEGATVVRIGRAIFGERPGL